uniref:Myozenin 3 n=1 Tax=Sphenodon punctatus TaxID=8508 RepID=A0A8D0GEZ6_SPHPU
MSFLHLQHPILCVPVFSVPQLDLGKKVSIPQDLMMEELSLQTNRGSQLYQKRQKRVQQFVMDHPSGYRIVSCLIFTNRLTTSLRRSYSEPLKDVPPEKFNSTAIPKGYRSPWREFLSSKDYQVDSENRLPELPKKANPLDFRSFNRTPTPFGGLLVNDMFPMPGLEMTDAQTDTLNSLELMCNRPSFNRAPRGWVQIMPESEEL